MSNTQKIVIYIFTRDLRLFDNLGLQEAVKVVEMERAKDQSDVLLLPLFVFTPEQTDKTQNTYFSQTSVRFMCESLLDLNQQLKGGLCMEVGTYEKVLQKIMKEYTLKGICISSDHTPYAKERETRIRNWATGRGKKVGEVHVVHGNHTLYTIGGNAMNEKQYQVFTAFYRNKSKEDPAKPVDFSIDLDHVMLKPTRQPTDAKVLKRMQSLSTPREGKGNEEQDGTLVGGREKGLELLNQSNLRLKRQYDTERNTPSIEGTTRLSAYLKYGCLSSREVFWQVTNVLGKCHGINRELYWRDFYARIVYYRPELLDDVDKHVRIRLERSRGGWNDSATDFQQWCTGSTGFPFIDAGMRQLAATGWMHNRLRMCVAMFLAKDLFIDWRKGLQFFAQSLVDIDFASNWGGWVWSAIGYADSTPFARIFNPWEQGKKYDPEALYIKRWVPELSEVPAKHIHTWHSPSTRALYAETVLGYPEPMVNHTDAYRIAKDIYRKGAV